MDICTPSIEINDDHLDLEGPLSYVFNVSNGLHIILVKT